MAAVDADNTATSRSILRNLDAFQQTEIVHQYSNFAEARKAMQEGKIYGFYYIPRGFSQDANARKQPAAASASEPRMLSKTTSHLGASGSSSSVS